MVALAGGAEWRVGLGSFVALQGVWIGAVRAMRPWRVLGRPLGYAGLVGVGTRRVEKVADMGRRFILASMQLPYRGPHHATCPFLSQHPFNDFTRVILYRLLCFCEPMEDR
jgi:hypothetical protein